MTGSGEDPKKGASKQDAAPDEEATGKPDAPDDEAAGKAGASDGGASRDGLASAILGLSKLCSESGKDGVSPEVTDAVTQALLLVLGTAPSVVTFEGLLSAQTSSGLMYHNAVSNQQKTNLLGMAMTAKCVRYMLDPYPEDVIDETVFPGDAGSL